MKLEELALAMQERVPWRVASKIFAEFEIPRGQGWKGTIEKISRGFEATDEQLAIVLDRYKQHLISGEKSVRIYKVPDEVLISLRDQFLNTKIEETAFSDSYPLPLDQSALDSLAAAPPQLVSVDRLEGGIAAIFVSVRASEVRIGLGREDLPASAQSLLDEFSEVFGIRTIKTQAFDAFIIPSGGHTVDVCVDCPIGAQQDTILAAHAFMENALNKHSGAEVFRSPVNLFPLIKHIYEANGEGVVVELGFVTRSASWKHEKMRRKHMCLRKEVYHVGGRDAVKGEIEPFRLGVEWNGPGTVGRASFPELALHSSARMMHSTHPTLYEGVIRKCTGFHDFEFVRGKIESYLADY